MNPQNLLDFEYSLVKKLSAGILVYSFLDLCKYCVRREHVPVFVRAVDADELRVDLALLPVNFTYAFLELDICLMYILGSFQIIPVSASSLALEL